MYAVIKNESTAIKIVTITGLQSVFWSIVNIGHSEMEILLTFFKLDWHLIFINNYEIQKSFCICLSSTAWAVKFMKKISK